MSGPVIVLAACLGVVVWLVLSEFSFRRNERLKDEMHAERMRRYAAETERMYGPRRTSGGQDG